MPSPATRRKSRRLKAKKNVVYVNPDSENSSSESVREDNSALTDSFVSCLDLNKEILETQNRPNHAQVLDLPLFTKMGKIDVLRRIPKASRFVTANPCS